MRQTKAEAQWAIVADALHEKQPKLGAMMDASRDNVLACMTLPHEYWPRIASTNPFERADREIRRRADVIGIFPNDEAIIRPVGAFGMGLGPWRHHASLLETNDEWAVARRYTSLERLAQTASHGVLRRDRGSTRYGPPTPSPGT